MSDPDEATSGQFTEPGRRAAIDTALPLLVTYFAGARTWSLEVSAQLDAGRTDDVDEFAVAARLRASLAAAHRLIDVVTQIIAQPSFRYTHVASESVGTIQGRLDLARYSRQRGRVDVPRRYPIRLIERATATPENVLAAYAVQWIKRDLDCTPPRLLPLSSPERRELDRLVDALARLLAVPLLARTVPAATEVWRRSSLDGLLDRVAQRLDAGHVAQPEPYRELESWIRASLDGAAIAQLGERDWSFYDERFDTKLFEIWALVMLAGSISRLVGAPDARPASLALRAQVPIFTWTVGDTVVRLHFQAALHQLTRAGVRWRHDPGGGPLMGFPDLAVVTEGPAGHVVTLFDPKLRRRAGVPTDELYKLLGYFANLDEAGPARGAILYYSPGRPTSHALRSRDGGEVWALGLDPEASRDDTFDVAADVVLRAAGLDHTRLVLF